MIELPHIREIEAKDKDWLKSLLKAQFGSERIVLRGKVVNAFDFPGFIAELDFKNVGVVLYEILSKNLEIITLVSIRPKQGVGTALIEKLKTEAVKLNKKIIKVITTNDNTQALRFYQKRGFDIIKFYPNSLAKLRVLKPELPESGNDGIPIRDEIELQTALY